MKKPSSIRLQGAALTAARYVFAFLMVAIVGALLVVSQGNSPVEALKAIVDGAFGTRRAFGTAIRWMTPTLITSISAVIAWRSGIWNVGIEGQMYMGAFVCAVVGYELALPRGLHIAVCLLAAGLSGMLFALIPALMKAFLNVNELISTLMLNYAATSLLSLIHICAGRWWPRCKAIVPSACWAPRCSRPALHCPAKSSFRRIR